MAIKSKDVKTSPAGNNDKISVNGIEFSNIIEKDKFEMKAAQKGVKIEVLSTELTENMTIKAVDDTVIDFETRKQQLKNNPKLAKYLKEKSKDMDADRAM